MSIYAYPDKGTGKDGEKKPITVQPPSAYAGIASALRASYEPLPMSDQLERLLARIK